MTEAKRLFQVMLGKWTRSFSSLTEEVSQKHVIDNIGPSNKSSLRSRQIFVEVEARQRFGSSPPIAASCLLLDFVHFAKMSLKIKDLRVFRSFTKFLIKSSTYALNGQSPAAELGRDAAARAARWPQHGSAGIMYFPNNNFEEGRYSMTSRQHSGQRIASRV